MTPTSNVQTITIGKLEIVCRKHSALYEFIDTTGQRRELVDYDGHVSRLIDAILNGPGELLETVVTSTPPEQPPSNVRPIFGNGSPRRPYLKG